MHRNCSTPLCVLCPLTHTPTHIPIVSQCTNASQLQYSFVRFVSAYTHTNTHPNCIPMHQCIAIAVLLCAFCVRLHTHQHTSLLYPNAPMHRNCSTPLCVLCPLTHTPTHLPIVSQCTNASQL